MREGKENPSFVEFLAGDTKKGSDDAAALPDRLSRYSKAHHRALDMANYIRNHAEHQEKTNLAAELKNCGSYLMFRDYFQVGKVRLSGMISCKKHMLCPLCAMRRGAKMLKAYLERLEVIRQESPGFKAYLVTLTVKDGADLLQRFDHLQNSLQIYTQQRRSAMVGKRQLVEFNKALGAVGSYEFKRGSGSGLWHPHFHAVWLCREDPDEVQLSREWHAITGDSFIVNVTPFHDQDDVVGGFLEVFKYALKFSDMPLEQNWHGFETLQGKRLVTSFGKFRGVQVPEISADDLLDDEPFVELFYRFRKGAGYSLVKASGVIDPEQRLFDGAPRSNLVNLVGHLATKYPTREATQGARLDIELGKAL
jgi:hypothetical protein